MSESVDRRSRYRGTAICLASAAALTLLAGCGSSAASTGAASGSSSMPTLSSGMSSSSSSSAGSSSSSSSAEVVLHISQFAYRTPASVGPGAKVTVMNMDGVKHTVTSDKGAAFDVSVDAGSSGTFTAPMTPGTYAFHCAFHSNMHGTLVVR